MYRITYQQENQHNDEAPAVQVTNTGTFFVQRVKNDLTEQPLEQRLNRSEVSFELRVNFGKVVIADEGVGEKYYEEQEQEEHQVSSSLNFLLALKIQKSLVLLY